VRSKNPYWVLPIQRLLYLPEKPVHAKTDFNQNKSRRTSPIASQDSNVGNKPTQPAALLSYETIQCINKWRKMKHNQQAAKQPRRFHLSYEGKTPTIVARDGRTVAQNEPPRLHSACFRYGGEQVNGVWIC
jgi:hypothetical protein